GCGDGCEGLLRRVPLDGGAEAGLRHGVARGHAKPAGYAFCIAALREASAWRADPCGRQRGPADGSDAGGWPAFTAGSCRRGAAPEPRVAAGHREAARSALDAGEHRVSLGSARSGRLHERTRVGYADVTSWSGAVLLGDSESLV